MSPPKKVLLITERYPPHVGGLARSSRRLAAHAAANGAGVHVLVLRGEGAAGTLDSCRDGAVWVHRLGAGRDWVETQRHAALVVDWLHARECFDLLHGQYASTAGFLAATQARLLGAAAYVSLRGNDVDRDVFDPARCAPLLWTLRHAHAVGGVSRALVHQANCLADRDDARYTPNAVEGSLFRPLPPDPDLRAGLGLGPGPVIGFAGELRQKKGASFLLDAFRALPPDVGAHLLLVGTIRAEERRHLEQVLAEDPEMAARVHCCPYLQDAGELAAVYALMDVAVCPSLWEGMPNFVLEAMACGRPVLASDAGGIPDVVTHGETGWLIGRHQLHRLGEGLREVLALPPEERAFVGGRARAHVLREFPPERERRELLAAYQAACAGAGRAH